LAGSIRSGVSSKDRLIRAESISIRGSGGRMTGGSLILQDPHNRQSGTPAHRVKLDEVFWTE
jgi:hypothetical protein